MPLNYNFAFKNSNLRRWKRPSPPNYLFTEASLSKKFIYCIKQINSNSELFYPPASILILSLIVHFINIYPNYLLLKFEDTHAEYSSISSRILNLNRTKSRIRTNLNKLESYFTDATLTYLFVFYLQNSVPEGVRLDSYAFSDTGFDIKASSFNIDSFNQFLTLMVESPVVKKNSVNLMKLQRNSSLESNEKNLEPNYQIEFYGDVRKLSNKKRIALYKESAANGLLMKLERFNNLKNLLD